MLQDDFDECQTTLSRPVTRGLRHHCTLDLRLITPLILLLGQYSILNYILPPPKKIGKSYLSHGVYLKIFTAITSIFEKNFLPICMFLLSQICCLLHRIESVLNEKFRMLKKLLI